MRHVTFKKMTLHWVSILAVGVVIFCTVSCSNFFAASNLAINPDGSETQLCSGRFVTDEGFVLCRRISDGALGAFGVFLEELTVTSSGDIVFADKLVIGQAEVTQEFRGLGLDEEGLETSFQDVFWELKNSDNSMLRLQTLQDTPPTKSAFESGDPDVVAAIEFIDDFVLHYYFNANHLLAAEGSRVYGYDHFFECVGDGPVAKETLCAELYDLKEDSGLDDGNLGIEDYRFLVEILDGEDAAALVNPVPDLSMKQYYDCEDIAFNNADDVQEGNEGTIIPSRCHKLDRNNDDIVNFVDIPLLFDRGPDAPEEDQTSPVPSAGLDSTLEVTLIEDTCAFITIYLFGSKSYDLETDRENLSYAWRLLEGSFPMTIDNADSEVASFTLLVCGRFQPFWQFELTVTDDDPVNPLSDIDKVHIELDVTTEEPAEEEEFFAEAGDAQEDVTSGDSVTLDGSGSQGTNLTYRWEQTGGTLVEDVDWPVNNQTVTFIAPDVTEPEVLTFRLTITGDEGTNTDEVSIVISPTGTEEGGTTPVVAEAGQTQTVTASDVVTLDGSESTGTNLTYLWEYLSATEGVTLIGATSEQATFIAPDVVSTTILQFRLTVTGVGGSDTDEVSIGVSPAE